MVPVILDSTTYNCINTQTNESIITNYEKHIQSKGQCPRQLTLLSQTATDWGSEITDIYFSQFWGWEFRSRGTAWQVLVRALFLDSDGCVLLWGRERARFLPPFLKILILPAGSALMTSAKPHPSLRPHLWRSSLWEWKLQHMHFEETQTFRLQRTG